MNHARIENSARLQRVHCLLKDGLWHSTRDIIENAHVCAVSAAVSELRENSIPVECEPDWRVYRYRLEERCHDPLA